MGHEIAALINLRNHLHRQKRDPQSLRSSLSSRRSPQGLHPRKMVSLTNWKNIWSHWLVCFFFSSKKIIWRFSWQPVPLGVADLKLSPNQLAWKSFVKLFADKGYVLWNYPEGVAFPCDDIKGKGIQGVPVKEQTILLGAFTHPTHPIKLVQTYKSGGVWWFS